MAVSISAVFTVSSSAQERRVKMKDLPEAVQKTVTEQSKGASIRGLSKETEKGKTIYEAELNVDGHSKDISMDSAGQVIEVEEQVQLPTLPEAVQGGIKQSAGTAHISMVESVTKGGVLRYYEVHVKKGGKSSEIYIGTDGKRLVKPE
jgi:uncharacterized membrane protein YkoI